MSDQWGRGILFIRWGFVNFFLRGKRGAEFCSFVVAHKTSRGTVSSKGERESERERERANGKGKGCEAIKEFKQRGGRDAEPYLDVDHNERRWDQ